MGLLDRFFGVKKRLERRALDQLEDVAELVLVRAHREVVAPVDMAV